VTGPWTFKYTKSLEDHKTPLALETLIILLIIAIILIIIMTIITIIMIIARNRNIDSKNENNDDYNNTNNIVCLKVTSQCNKAGFGTPITRTQQVDENKGKKFKNRKFYTFCF